MPKFLITAQDFFIVLVLPQEEVSGHSELRQIKCFSRGDVVSICNTIFSKVCPSICIQISLFDWNLYPKSSFW